MSLRITRNVPGFRSWLCKRHSGEKKSREYSSSRYIVKNKLVSVQNKQTPAADLYNEGETYTTLAENDFTLASAYPETAFALNTNRASYSNIRRILNQDMEVPPDAVRIEEMLNYFNFSNKALHPQGNFTISTLLTQAPWNKENRLLFVNLQAPYINTDSIPPANLVFLIDVSGSMDQANRLPLIKDAFKLLVNNLRKQDRLQ